MTTTWMGARRGARFLVTSLCCFAGLFSWAADAFAQEGATPIIPRQLLFGNPDRANPQFSPDGKQISFLAEKGGYLNVWVAPADDLSKARAVTNDTTGGIRIYTWAYTSQHILYALDSGGNENWRLFVVDLQSNETRPLTPAEGVQARIQQLSPRFPDEVLIGLNNRDPQLHDIYRLNIRTGEQKLVQQNPGVLAFVSDDEFQVRFALRVRSDGGQDLLRNAPGKDWEVFTSIPAEDNLTTSPAGFDKTGQTLYLIDSRGRDTSAFTAVDLKSGETKVLFQDPRADVQGWMIHPTEKTVQAVAADYDRSQWKVLDPSIREDMDYLTKVVDGDFDVTSRSEDDRHWIVTYTVDRGPARFYHYDRPAKTATLLFTARKALEDQPLARMHPVILKSRDQKDLVCYLSLPVASDKDDDARPDRPLATVLIVHGGPWARDQWGFNPMHQWLANRGYAVLSVNFRGSTGFGKSFTNAGNLEWGRKMQDDLIDAVNWAVSQGVADKQQVGILGGSYGGYAVLAGLTLTPDVFACGVDIFGPVNLVTLLQSIPPYWAPMVEMFATRVGDHRTEQGQGLLKERSPLTHVDRIRKPLLIAQGANDPRVKQAESDQIVEAMRAKKLPVTYVLYPDEGHGFQRPKNRLSFYAVAEAFLSRHLGGQFEPFGEEFEGSTIQVPEGVEGVPGLKGALPSKSSNSE